MINDKYLVKKCLDIFETKWNETNSSWFLTIIRRYLVVSHFVNLPISQPLANALYTWPNLKGHLASLLPLHVTWGFDLKIYWVLTPHEERFCLGWYDGKLSKRPSSIDGDMLVYKLTLSISLCVSMFMSVCLYVYLSVCLSVCLCVCLSVWLSHMIVTYDCHICLSHMIVTYDCHIWLSHMIVTYDCHISLSHMIVTYDCHILLPHTIATYYCHIQLPHTIVTYNCHIQLSHTIATYYCHTWLPHMIVKIFFSTGHWWINLFYL